MGVGGLWTWVLGLFKNKPHERLSLYKGKRVGIDVSILLNKCNGKLETQLATTNLPPYPSPELKAAVKHYDVLFRNEGVTPVYVFDGPAPPIKDDEKKRRQEDREKAGEDWVRIVNEVKDSEIRIISDDDLDKAVSSRKKMAHPTVLDHVAVISWMKSEGMECYGSIGEADYQLRKLEKDGVIDCIATEDGDLIILEGIVILSKLSTKGGHLSFRVFDRKEFFESPDVYKSKLGKHRDMLPDFAPLLGNDYLANVPGNGTVTVLYDKDWKQHIKTGKRKDNGLIDSLARAPNRREWLEEYAKSNAAVPAGWVDRYELARNFILHPPVLEKCSSTEKVSVVPLNPVPEGANWVDMIGYDPVEFALVGEYDFEKIYNLDLAPLTGLPLSQHIGPVYSEREMSDAPEHTPLPLFARLDFDAVPVEIQPLYCLQMYLLARGVKTRESDTRATIERLVNTCRTIKKEVLPPSVSVKPGKCTGFEVLDPRLAGNEYDHWSRNYFRIAKKLRKVTDEMLSSKLGGMLQNTKERAALLFEGKHLNPKSIQCLNVTSKISGDPCIMFRCDCLSSERSVIHITRAVFKDTGGGDFLLSPHSTCSCEDGALFCSHMLAFLFLIAVIQMQCETQQFLEEKYQADAKVLSAMPVLIECIAFKDKFKRSKAQKDRVEKKCRVK